MLNLPPAFIPATQTRIVHSALANDDYLISVALPFHYEEKADETWPVICARRQHALQHGR
jgi:hypothetical protein